MVMFIFKRVLKKLYGQKRTYLLMMIQFAVGFFILNTFISSSVTINGKLGNLIRDSKNNEFSIYATYKDKTFFQRETFSLLEWGKEEPQIREFEEVPFDSGDLKNLQEEFPNVDFSINVEVDIIYLGGEEGEQYKVYYSSLYKDVKVSEGFLNILKEGNSVNMVNPRDFPHSFDESEFIALNGEKYNYNIIKSEENLIYIPIDAYYDIYHPKDLVNIKFKMMMNDEKISYFDLINNVYTKLYESNNETFLYDIESEFANFLAHVNRAAEESVAFNFIVIVLLIIILIGLSGLFVLTINKRKKEIAICLALGANKVVVYCEIILEMSIIALMGTALGIVGSLFLLSNDFEIATVVVSSSNAVVLGLFVLSIFSVIISSIPVLISIKKLMPIEILRST
jgi:ABC-type antimicrobial peptide transport system permease subunit